MRSSKRKTWFMKKLYRKRRHFKIPSLLKIIIVYNTVSIIIASIFHPLIPLVLNAAPGLIDKGMDVKWTGLSYTFQYITVFLIILLVGNIFLFRSIKEIGKVDELLKDYKNNITEINQIREKCIDVPYLIYTVLIIFPVILTLLIEVINAIFFNVAPITVVKMTVIIFSLVSLIAIISLMISKRVFTRILINTYSDQKFEGKRIGLQRKIFLQVLPMFILAVLFTSLVGYSRLIKEKGDLLFEFYKDKLEYFLGNIRSIESIEQIQELLKKIKFERNNYRACSFIITPDKRTITSDSSKLTQGFKDYLRDVSFQEDGRVYDYTGEIQGVAMKIKGINGEYIVGIKYEVASKELLIFFSLCSVLSLILNIFVLIYFSKSLTDDISLIAQSLTEIAEGGEVNLNKKLPVTSNDEIGDLVIAFNKIQEIEKQHIERIRDNQNMLMERERLASLGQLIGGIAHNLRSPIMSLSGSIEGLKDLIKEYDESVDDQDVTPEDHHEIAKEMFSWIQEMQPYCSYMSDLIAAVKEQVVQLNASTISSFTLDELVKRVELLMKYELLKYNCIMNIDIQADLNMVIHGEVNNLVQVCNNLIINAIQSYENKGGLIEFGISKQNNDILISVRDYGHGIPKEIQARLFKEMVTTKGKNGTGLGLYMSYLNIKGRFGGQLWFESEEGKGAAFYISIPVNYYGFYGIENQEV